MINATIESAQKKLEARNFSIRKNVLQFDDVMNSQREIIYSQRQKVLAGEDVSGNVHTMMHESITETASLYLGGDNPAEWNFEGLRDYYLRWLCGSDDFHYDEEALKNPHPRGRHQNSHRPRRTDYEKQGKTLWLSADA